jgi:hypothetical protein
MRQSTEWSGRPRRQGADGHRITMDNNRQGPAPGELAPGLACPRITPRLPALGDVGRNRVHQGRRQAVIGLQSQLLQARPDRRHLRRIGAGLDDGRNKGGELRRRPAANSREFGMHEIEAVERMRLVLDAAVHMHAAAGAGMTLDGRVGVDDLQLLRMGGDLDLSRETTATCENKAPSGFQHLLQPQAWLCAVCALIVTSTRSEGHLQRSTPPSKPGSAGIIPASIDG